MMSNNFKDRFVASNFDEIDMVLDTDRRFEEAIAAADAGEEDLVDASVKDLKESGEVCTAVKEDDLVQYNPEDLDSDGILDDTAEEICEYVADYDYDDEDGELIDSVMSGDSKSYEGYDDEE